MSRAHFIAMDTHVKTTDACMKTSVRSAKRRGPWAWISVAVHRNWKRSMLNTSASGLRWASVTG